MDVVVADAAHRAGYDWRDIVWRGGRYAVRRGVDAVARRALHYIAGEANNALRNGAQRFVPANQIDDYVNGFRRFLANVRQNAHFNPDEDRVVPFRRRGDAWQRNYGFDDDRNELVDAQQRAREQEYYQMHDPESEDVKSAIEQIEANSKGGGGMLSPYAIRLKKRKRRGKKQKPRIPPQSTEMGWKKLVNWEMAHTIDTTNSATLPTWGIAALCDWEDIHKVLEDAYVPTDINPIDSAEEMNVTTTAWLVNNSVKLHVTNTKGSYVRVIVTEWVAKRSFHALGGLALGTTPHMMLFRNIWTFAQAYDEDLFQDRTEYAIVMSSGTAAANGVTGIPTKITTVAPDKPVGLRLLDPYIKRSKSTEYVAGPGQSFSHIMTTKPVHLVQGLTHIYDESATAFISPTTTIGLPMAHAGVTKFMTIRVVPIQLSRSSDTTNDPRESYSGGTYRLHADVTYSHTFKNIKYQSKGKIFTDWRPDIAVATTEIHVGHVDIKATEDPDD